jgi:hypothetical protein
MELIERILNYNFGTDELDEVGEMTSADELFAVLNQLLGSSKEEEIIDALGFIRDFMIMSVSPERKVIRDRYPESSLVKTIENLLFAPNHSVRNGAIYTLGKTCSYSSVDIITEAFYHFRDVDPILLPKLLGELGWLQGETWEKCSLSMLESPCYLTHWAAIPMLSRFIDLYNDTRYRFKAQQFDRLRHHENVLIRQEAEYEYHVQKELREEFAQVKALRREQRQLVRQRKAVGNRMKRLHQQREKLEKHCWKTRAQQYEPKIYFDTIAHSFGTYWMRPRQQVDYTIAELETFVTQYVAFCEQLQQDSYTHEEIETFFSQQI